MIEQKTLEFRARGRGTTEITAEVARSILTSNSFTIPVADGRLLLGTWQVYVWEHRRASHSRSLVVTVMGDDPANPCH